MRVERVIPGRRVPGRLVGGVLTRDITVDGHKWTKGRRLSEDDVLAMSATDPGPPVTVIVAEAGELHEDDAAIRLAKAVAGPNLDVRGPKQSRLDLVAAKAGVVTVLVAELDRINRLDPLEVFTVFDGQIVERGDLVASVKIAPHVVDAGIIDSAARLAGFGSQPVVWVSPFGRRLVGVVVKQSIRGVARTRFEESVRAKVEGLGSKIIDIVYVEDDPDAVETAVGRFTRGAEIADLILTAGSASTDPQDAFFTAIDALGGRIVRRGVPAHPGSMLWLAKVGGTSILGLPTCGAYSKATAVDLLLPRLLAGEPANERTVAKLGHGGILTRSQRFRFPPYARELDAPDG